MPQGKDTADWKVAEIVSLLTNTDYSHREIARRTNVSNFTVSRIARIKAKEGVFKAKRKGRCGSKRITSNVDDRFLLREVKKDYGVTTSRLRKRLQDAGTNVSRTTVWRRLRQVKCESKKPRKVPLLTKAMKRKRLQFALEHSNWTSDNWRKVRLKICLL